MIYKKNIFFSNLREKGYEEKKIGGIFYFMGLDVRSEFMEVTEEEQQRLPFMGH